MSSLLSRAKAIVTVKPAIAGALVILPLAAAAPAAHASVQASPYSFTGQSATFSLNGGSGGSISDPTATFGATGSNPLALNGSATTPASTWINNNATEYTMQWTGNLNGSFFPVGATITLHYDFTITRTATSGSLGTANWSLNDSVDNALPLSSSGTLPFASTHITGGASLPLTTALTSNVWSATLNITWTGEDPSASMNISVPSSSSIDLSVATPEPASLSLVGLAGATLLVKRRRA